MKKTLTLLTCLLAFLVLCPSLHAAERKEKEVRVGWFESVFNQTDRFGRRSGYAYEYQQKIAAYTGWTYRYVSGSWVELFEKLQRGEIDLLADVSLTEERKGQFLFSEQSMGTEDYYIFIKPGNKKIVPDNFQTLNGKRIGVNKGSVQEQMFRQWAAEHDVKVKLVSLSDTESEYHDKLDSGELDGLVFSASFDAFYDDFIPAAFIGNTDFYFAINRYRPDLQLELNGAQNHILRQNRLYNRMLNDKYLISSSIHKYFTPEEADWLKRHGTIRIGYRDNYIPYCGEDPETHQVDGLLEDMIQSIPKSVVNAELSFEAIAYPSANEALEAMERGEVDCVFPISLSTFDAEVRRVLITDPVVDSKELAVVRAKDPIYINPESHVRVAINSGNPNYLSVVRDVFPLWEMVQFPSTRACLEGISKDQADVLLISSYRLNVLSDQIKEFGLTTISTGASMKLSFAVKSEDIYLYSILGRFSNVLTETEIYSSLAAHSIVPREVTFGQYVREHLVGTLIVLVAIIALITGLLILAVLTYRKTRKLNEKLKHRQKMLTKAKAAAEAANSAKTSFLFNMSHDIRTPMNAVIGYTDLLIKHLDTPACFPNYLEKIRTSSQVLLSIINNVLEMARIEKGTVTIEEVPSDLSKSREQLFDIFGQLMREKDIELTCDVNVQHTKLYGDPTNLRNILINLVSNAYKYTEPGGCVHVGIDELPSERSGWVNIRTTVADSGIGMSPDFLPHIFEEFTRESNSSRNKIEGTGLGLPIVKRLVELMGGTIDVKSQKGVGTTFITLIPHRIAEEVECEEQFEPVGEGDVSLFKGRHILMAEDNDLNAEIAQEILQELGFVIDRVEDGSLCVQRVIEAAPHQYDLILMDIQMPNMNGYEATRNIRALTDSEKAHIPIVAMTANAFEEDKRQAINAGMNAHLAKPIDASEMIKTLSAILRGGVKFKVFPPKLSSNMNSIPTPSTQTES